MRHRDYAKISIRLKLQNIFYEVLSMKKRAIQVLSLVLLSLILLTIVGCGNNTEPLLTDAVAYPMKTEQLKIQKLSASTDFYAENVLSYENDSNEPVLRIYSAPIETSENTITREADGYSGDGAFMKKTLPEIWSQEYPMHITQGTNFAAITPVTSNEYSAEQKEAVNIFEQSRDTVVYKDAFGKGVDLNCSLTSFGVNLEIVFSKRPEQNTYQINLKLPDLVPDTGSPDYILFKTALEKGEVKTILETPLTADKNGKWSYTNSVRLTAKDGTTGTYTVEYTVDEAFLSDKSTKYPVRVNQSVSLYKSKQPDTTAYENTGEEAGHYLSPYMLLGDSTIKGEGWTYIRYETLNNLNIDADKVVSAKYVFRNLFDLPKEVKIGAYAVTADWCSINTRWFNQPTYDERPISQVAVKYKGDYSVDITPLFKEMIRNKGQKEAKYSVRNSFMFKADTSNSNLIFPSGDGGLFSPFLEVMLAE